MTRAVAIAARVAAVAGCLAFGCESEEAPAAAGSEKLELPAAERTRGETACERYVARVCACAEDDDAFEEECALAKGRPEALQMALGAAAASGNLDERDRAASIRTARRIIQKCFEAEARLDPAICPRP